MNRTAAILLVILAVCAAGICVYLVQNGDDSDDRDEDGIPTDPEVVGMELILTVDGTEIEVDWQDNASVDAIKTLAKDTLTIEMERYGGFEQTGRIGTTIPSSDSSMDVGSGDILLYQSRQVCLYFDDNSYSFTRLGRITGMSESEITELLDKPSVTAVFTLRPSQSD